MTQYAFTNPNGDTKLVGREVVIRHFVDIDVERPAELKEGEEPREVAVVRSVEIALMDVRYSGETIRVWTDEQRAAVGVYPVREALVPAGRQVKGEPRLAFRDDHFDQIIETEVAPAEPEAPRSYTPREVLGALKTWKALDEVLKIMTEADKVEFYTASTVTEDEPWLLALLSGAGKTVEDLRVAT